MKISSVPAKSYSFRSLLPCALCIQHFPSQLLNNYLTINLPRFTLLYAVFKLFMSHLFLNQAPS